MSLYFIPLLFDPYNKWHFPPSPFPSPAACLLYLSLCLYLFSHSWLVLWHSSQSCLPHISLFPYKPTPSIPYIMWLAPMPLIIIKTCYDIAHPSQTHQIFHSAFCSCILIHLHHYRMTWSFQAAAHPHYISSGHSILFLSTVTCFLLAHESSIQHPIFTQVLFRYHLQCKDLICKTPYSPYAPCSSPILLC